MLRQASRGLTLPRAFARRGLAMAARFTAYGEPMNVLKLEEVPDPPAPASGEVSVRMLAAPVNPSDLNMVEGTYGIRPPLPAVGGSEGLGRVTAVGPGVASPNVGDLVVMGSPMLGTWQTQLNAPAAAVIPVPFLEGIEPAYAATLTVNPAAAYRMLHDFVALSPGDVVVQNGATSMVGQAVVQLARDMGVTTVNVVPHDKPDRDRWTGTLLELGADVVVGDDDVNAPWFRELMADLPPAKLGLNCVSGTGATEVARAVGRGATVVTYGGLSKEPVVVPGEALVQKGLAMRGFWLSAWNEQASVEERVTMLEELAKKIKTRNLVFFYVQHDFDDFSFALQTSLEVSRSLRKTVLNMDYPDRLAEKRTPEEMEAFSHSAIY